MNTAKSKLPNKKNSLVSLVLIALVLAGYLVYSGTDLAKVEKISLTAFKQDIKKEQIEKNKVTVEGDKLSYVRKDGVNVFTYKEPTATINDFLLPAEIAKINLEIEPENTFYSDLLVAAIPVVLIVLFFMGTLKSTRTKAFLSLKLH